MTGEQTQRAAFEKWIDEPRPEPLQQRHAWDDCRDAFYAGWLAAQAQRAPGSEAERAIFEKWSTGMGLYRHHGLEVRFDDAAWAVWQARAAIATHQTSERQPEPVAFANARDLESMLDGQFGSLLAFRYKTAERSAALYAAPPVQAPFDATAEPIWDQLTKIGESAPPGVWASVQAPADEVKRLADELPEPEWWAEEHGTGKRGRRGIYRKSQLEKQGQGDYFGLFTADQMRAAIHAAIDALCNPGEAPHGR